MRNITAEGATNVVELVLVEDVKVDVVKLYPPVVDVKEDVVLLEVVDDERVEVVTGP
jgi:hypothetical protein